MKAVIQAGGMGTRLRGITKDLIPKPLAEMAGKPILELQLEQLKTYGIRDVIIVVGHLGEKIEEYFGDGSDREMNISYIYEKEPLGSAGALYYIKDIIGIEDFLLIFGDVVFSINLNRMIKFHKVHKSEATLFVHPNGHPADSDLVIMDSDNRILKFDSKNNKRDYWYSNCVNAGVYILSGRLVQELNKPEKVDLEHDLLQKLVKNNKPIYGYRSSEYVKDAGTEDRFWNVEQDINSGIVEMRNLKYPQKCIFLDRDGTINQYNGLVYKEEQFLLMEKVAEAIRLINKSGYLAIVITNQPVVARGMCSLEEVELIHRKMETLLGREGAYFDDIIFCPHHPDKGYPEENVSYKVACDCRKPNTGMIRRMVEKYNIDCSKSYIIGDTTTDIKTGKNANLKTVLLKSGEGGRDKKYQDIPDYIAEDLYDAVNNIIYEEVDYE